MNRPNHDLADSSGYEIRIDGRLDDRWSAWFDDLTLTHGADGTTVIRCPVIDQATLHGLLRRVRDVGLPIVSVTRSNHPSTSPEGDPR